MRDSAEFLESVELETVGSAGSLASKESLELSYGYQHDDRRPRGTDL